MHYNTITMNTKNRINKEINEHLIDRNVAVRLGMGKLTTPYKQSEWSMLINVISDMRASNINYGLVKSSSGIEVWRTGMKTLDEE